MAEHPPEPVFAVGDIVKDPASHRVGRIQSVQWNDDVGEWLYYPSFCGEFETFLDVALWLVEPQPEH